MSPESGVPAYASTRLIAYIGNKRALLPFLLDVFREIDGESGVRRFLDPFAGSGSVSRLARSLGWSVAANDAEEYSLAVNEAWLGVSADELPGLFALAGGIERAFASVNELHPQREDREPESGDAPYLSAHYAPSTTAGADWRRERLFYTRENAVFLDRARSEIDESWPALDEGGTSRGGPEGRARAAERALLLGAIVYVAATHANTSGLFKAYHKGFGGHGRDALGRILSPMRLEPPVLWGGPPSEVVRSDAAAFCRTRSADLCYLDPPYNQHQYGSNYHLLNTIARWDRASVDDSRAPDGSLLRAAGIPQSWKESRSAFCSRQTAGAAFRELLGAVDSRAILLSYNTEGLVPPEELVELLSDRADVELRSLDYVKYRGGRQSASRRSRNREILFVARRREGRGLPSPAGGSANSCADAARAASAALAALEADTRLARALSGAFDSGRLRELCVRSGAKEADSLAFGENGSRMELRSYRCLVIEERSRAEALRLDLGGKRKLASLLEPLILPDNAAACREAAALLAGGARERRMEELALLWLRKLAHRRYQADFRELVARLRGTVGAERELAPRLSAGLDEIETLFEARLAGSRRRGD